MKIAIIGAGASGLACGIAAAQNAVKNNLKVNITIFESKDKAGRKILTTGNGRCNLMNLNEGSYYFDKNGFSDYALKKFNVRSNLDFFAELGLYTRSDEEGRIYPLSNQASSVLDALRFACNRLGVKIVCDSPIEKIKATSKGFELFDKGFFDVLVLACGGKAGVKSFNGYELLKQLGHNVTDIKPSLTKLEVKDKKFTKQLKGIRQKGSFSIFDSKEFLANEKGELLFTDYGLSGIAIMQLSAYAVRAKNVSDIKIKADFVSELSQADLFNAIKAFADANPTERNENLLSGFVAKKLGEAILKKLDISLSDTFASLDNKKIQSITLSLKNYCFEIASAKGFEDAQVTAGGAECKSFNNKTMESKIIKSLYCIGELLDVDGLCGGYNLHWAWSSGRLCGESIINKYMNQRG